MLNLVKVILLIDLLNLFIQADSLHGIAVIVGLLIISVLESFGRYRRKGL